MSSRERLHDLVRLIVDNRDAITAAKTYERYRARLWAAVQRLYDGGRDAAFMATFIRSIDVQLTEAWNKGGDDMGVAPDEMSPDDMGILEAIINNETEFINRLAGDIQAAVDDGIEKDAFDKRFSARVDLWANRYNETVNRAHMVFGSKQRMEWVLGATEEHCATCPQLAGIVAFGHEWESSRFHPQMPPNNLLECGGWRCLCTLKPTKKRRTARALDRLTQIATRV